jgi:putative flippase GtrA
MSGSEPLVAPCPDNSPIDRKSSDQLVPPPEQPEHAQVEEKIAGSSLPRWASLQRFPVAVVLLRKLSKFLVVGGTGVGVNSAALFLLYQVFSLPLVIASLLATELAIASNFYWNDRWTFGRRRPSWGRFFKFNLVALGGVLITAITLWGLVTLLRMPYLFANLLGILLATCWNFIVNVFWTWGGSCL